MLTTSPAPTKPTEQSIQHPGNRLANESSLYLRQHANNPLNWFPWGPEALEKARREDRPIFLSIGYASCHWCHVMEHEVFEQQDVADFMNSRFVCIKVDREERPDLDTVYMEAVQTLTGGGGWPLSVFLTPDLKPFFGGTYFPHPTFMALTQKIHRLFKDQRATLELDSQRLASAVAAETRTSQGITVDQEVITQATQQALDRLDSRWGGFRSQQKFPTPVHWQFLLHQYRRSGNGKLGQALRTTLDNVGSGGIQDHIGGGFHRYTVEPTWMIPHFEKMLYDNAQMASLYTEAAVVFQEPRYQEIAVDTLDFLLRQKRSDQGTFFASFDADSGGEEGSYYTWTPQQLKQVAGEEDGALLAQLLGVTESGNFEGSNVVSRRGDLEQLTRVNGLSSTQLEGVFYRWRTALRTARENRTAPALDRKVVTSWNGLTIAALAQAYSAFAEPRYLQAGTTAARTLWQKHRAADGALYRASTDGECSGQAVLDDYAFFAHGLMELYKATSDPTYLTQSLQLIDRVVQDFAHPQGGFYMITSEQETPLGRPVQLFDSVEPSANAVMLHLLLAAHQLTGREVYREHAERSLQARAELLRRAGLEFSWWLDAAQAMTGPYYQVVIAGATDAAETQELAAAYRKLLHPAAVLTQVAATGAPADQDNPLLKGKTQQNGKATAYVCQRGACQAPTNDPQELIVQLLQGWSPNRPQ